VRLNAVERYGVRLALTGLALFLVGVPFALLLLAVQQNWAPLRDLDRDVAAGLHEIALREDGLVDTLRFVSDIGGPTSFRVAAAVLALWLLRRGARRLAVWLLVTSFGGALLVVAVKAAVNRARPALPDPVETAASASFPSGHAFGSLVGAGVLLLVLLPRARPARRRMWWWLSGIVVVAVGFSRIGLGVHYVTDVVAGWVLGVAWLAATIAVFQAWRADVGARPRPVEAGLTDPG
jgi:membrane-associated phospholipid phosphatase